jgi:[ribosomal protein S18]-alanine N-acetyltransferase
MEPRDIESVLVIQRDSPEIAQWSAGDYDRVARGEMAGWVADVRTDGGTPMPDTIDGFIVARRIGPDMEVLNFAVRSKARRRGIGAALLNEAILWGRSFHAEHAILEVRESNAGALRFYELHSFHVVGRRPRYYTAPVEDALLLSAPLTNSI